MSFKAIFESLLLSVISKYYTQKLSSCYQSKQPVQFGPLPPDLATSMKASLQFPASCLGRPLVTQESPKILEANSWSHSPLNRLFISLYDLVSMGKMQFKALQTIKFIQIPSREFTLMHRRGGEKQTNAKNQIIIIEFQKNSIPKHARKQ